MGQMNLQDMVAVLVWHECFEICVRFCGYGVLVSMPSLKVVGLLMAYAWTKTLNDEGCKDAYRGWQIATAVKCVKYFYVDETVLERTLYRKYYLKQVVGSWAGKRAMWKLASSL